MGEAILWVGQVLRVDDIVKIVEIIVRYRFLRMIKR